MVRLFHIALRAEWEQALEEGAYRVSTLGRQLGDEGFIHLAFAEQVKRVADRVYRGRTDLVLLELDPDRIVAPVRVEAVSDSDEQFPHVYGEIPVHAVMRIHTMPPGSDGTFDPLT